MKKNYLLLAILLVNILTAIAQKDIKIGAYTSTNNPVAGNYFNKGVASYEKNDFTNAVSFYKSAIAADTNFIDAYDNLGLSFRKLNLLDSAEFYYLASHAKYPKGMAALQNLAIVEKTRKHYENAIGYYKQMIALEPEDPEAYYGLCNVQLDEGKFDDALTNGQFAEKYYKQANSPYIGDCYYSLLLICYNTNNKTLGKHYLSLCKSSGVNVDQTIADAMN